jgi:uncharacterized RDD family membrane protein YckC
VYWTVGSAGSVALHGGCLRTDAASPGDLKLMAGRVVHPMDLGTAGAGISPALDVAVAPSENSLVVVVNTREETLASLLFDERGDTLRGVLAVDVTQPRRNLQIGQNLALLLLVLVFSLSIWQWRQKAAEIAMPVGLIAAPLHLRAIAFLIDAAVPYLIVLTVFGAWGNGVFSLVLEWLMAFSRPELLVNSMELLVFLGLYLVHVTVGELFFRRSLGKALTGLQVLMADGKSPTLGAIFLRNLVRLPELIVGVVVLYILITDQHQRLGDLLARTLVVSSEPPVRPEDPDKPPKKS